MAKTKSMLLVSSILASILFLNACSAGGNDSSNGSAETGSNRVIEQGAVSMQAETTKLQAALDKADEAEVKKLGKSINDLWISIENNVRQTFPLEYTEVEKYEIPIYSASAYDKVDLESLKTTAVQLQEALEKLKNAKPATAGTSEVLAKAVENYKQYVIEQVDLLVKQTQLFVDAVKAGEIDKAKAEYAAARVYFERIEPIAESFGELDPKIDARLADVDNENEWSGFHRIERALWQDNTTTGQALYADQLVTDIAALQKEISGLTLEPKSMVAGAMELLNEAATSKISGEEELYSHLDLVDLAANVEGSKAVYQAIIPALNENNPELSNQLDKQFTAFETTLMSCQSKGVYITYDKLTTEQIRTISDELSQLSNLMSQTAAIL